MLPKDALTSGEIDAGLASNSGLLAENYIPNGFLHYPNHDAPTRPAQYHHQWRATLTYQHTTIRTAPNATTTSPPYPTPKERPTGSSHRGRDETGEYHNWRRTILAPQPPPQRISTYKYRVDRQAGMQASGSLNGRCSGLFLRC